VRVKIRTGLGLLTLGVGITAAPLTLEAQNALGDHIDTGANQMLKSPDIAFAIHAAQGGAAEVKMGKLAAEKASDPDLKTFGQQMVDDHTKANDQLTSVAKQENMTLPSDLTAKDEAMYTRLEKLSGLAFDRAYVADMLKDHEADVKEFQREAHSGTDSAIKNFASQTLPVLQEHLEKIKSIHSKMGSGSST
jgi:putative membrane protein